MEDAAEYMTHGTVLRVTEASFPAPFDTHVYTHPYTSRLVESVAAGGLAEQVAQTVVESAYYDRPGRSTSPPGAADDPEELARHIREGGQEGSEVLMRWLGDRNMNRVVDGMIGDESPHIDLFRLLDTGDARLSWAHLLLSRLFRFFDPMPERMCRKFEDQLATGHAMSTQFRAKWMGWVAHQVTMRGLYELPYGLEDVEGSLAPKIRELIPDGRRSRRRRTRDGGAVPGTLRHKIEGIQELHDSLNPILIWADQVQTGLQRINETLEQSGFFPDPEIDPEVRPYLDPDGPIPDLDEVLDHREQLLEAVRTSNTLWLHRTSMELTSEPRRVLAAVPRDLHPVPPHKDRDELLDDRDHFHELEERGDLSFAEALDEVRLLQAVVTLLAGEQNGAEWEHETPLQPVRGRLSKEYREKLEAGDVAWSLEMADACERPGWIEELPERGGIELPDGATPRLAFGVLRDNIERFTPESDGPLV